MQNGESSDSVPNEEELFVREGSPNQPATESSRRDRRFTRILLGETEQDLSTAICDFFSAQNCSVQLENNGLRIIECLRSNRYDVLILELALPGLDAINIIQDYRSAGGEAPALLLCARSSSDEIEKALDAGIDAYLVRPFLLKGLAAQVRALLRRPALRDAQWLASGDIAMNPSSAMVTRSRISVHLHPMEFKLLQFLLQHPDQVFTAAALFERVWQRDSGRVEDTVRTHIRTLRQKLEIDGLPSIIITIRGLGYMVESP